MAVSVQVPQYSKLGMWNLGDPPNTFTSSGAEGVPTSMSYHYSIPPAGLDSVAQMIPSFHHPQDHDAPSPASTKQSTPTLKSREGTAVSKAEKLKRSMSTPNVRGQASAEALALSAEKRRNKLGYHRTSVACGHCRRRKIRCIPAPADPQNRCSNCIRLKKECNFFPVDQQPPPDPTARRGSKTQIGRDKASESSSPSTASVQLPELVPTLPYPHLTMPSIQDLGGSHIKRPRTESFSPENKVVATTRNFEYNHGSTTGWMAPEASPSTKSEAPQPYWRSNHQESPITPAFSPFTPSLHIPPPQNWPTTHTEPGQREESTWSAPQRSMSYNNLDPLNSNPQHYSTYSNSLPPVPDHYTTKPRPLQSMYSLPTSTAGIPITSAEASATSHGELPMPQHSHAALPPLPYVNWQQQPYSYQKSSTSASMPDQYGGYNAGHPPNTQHESGALPPPPSSYGGYTSQAPAAMYYQDPHSGR